MLWASRCCGYILLTIVSPFLQIAESLKVTAWVIDLVDQYFQRGVIVKWTANTVKRLRRCIQLYIL